MTRIGAAAQSRAGSKRIGSLIGCDGELPKGAPPGEVAMHDAKWALRTAENLLDGHNPNGVQRLLDRAASIMNAAPSDPRVNFARLIYYKDAAPFYRIDWRRPARHLSGGEATATAF